MRRLPTALPILYSVTLLSLSTRPEYQSFSDPCPPSVGRSHYGFIFAHFIPNPNRATIIIMFPGPSLSLESIVFPPSFLSIHSRPNYFPPVIFNNVICKDAGVWFISFFPLPLLPLLHHNPGAFFWSTFKSVTARLSIFRLYCLI